MLLMPPSMTKSELVMNELSSEARKTAARRYLLGTPILNK